MKKKKTPKRRKSTKYKGPTGYQLLEQRWPWLVHVYWRKF